MAIRLAAVAIGRAEDPDRWLAGLDVHSGLSSEFIADDILGHLPSGLHEWIAKTSILDRFCAELVDAVCGQEKTLELDGRRFLEGLHRSGLPCQRLDGKGQWHRYHHLVGDFLRDRLREQLDEQGLSTLHARAAGWFEDQGLLDESILHLVRARDFERAADLVCQHRRLLFAAEE